MSTTLAQGRRPPSRHVANICAYGSSSGDSSARRPDVVSGRRRRVPAVTSRLRAAGVRLRVPWLHASTQRA